MKTTLCLMSIALALSACSKVHDVAYYESNPAERDAKLATCHNLIGAFGSDKECVSAWHAMGVHAVSYWRQNGLERKAILQRCGEHSATLSSSPNCQNASRAQAASLGRGKPIYARDR